MKSKLAATLAALALVLTGCGASNGDATPTASAPSEAALSEWVSSVGLADSLKQLSASLSQLSTDVSAVAATDTKGIADGIAKHGPDLLQIAVDIASEPASDDTAYEALRTTTAMTIRAFAKLAIGLSTVSDAERLTAVNTAIAAITPMNEALKPLSEYIGAHGTDTVHPAA